MMDIGTGSVGFAVLDKGAAQYEDDFVGFMVVDTAHSIAWLPFDQYRALTGLRIFKEDLPSRTRRELERAYVLGVDILNRLRRLHRHDDLLRVAEMKPASSTSLPTAR